MAQESTTSLSATNTKVVPGFPAQKEAKISFEVPATIGGWQMELVLPDGITLESESGELEVGTKPDTGWPAATIFPNVKPSSLHKNHKLIGGVNTDGNVLLVCVPTANEEAITKTSGQLCTIKLKAFDSFKDKGTQTVTIKKFIASDPTGDKTYEAEDVTFKIVELKYDVDGNGQVNVYDIRKLINEYLNKTKTVFDIRKAVNEYIL